MYQPVKSYSQMGLRELVTSSLDHATKTARVATDTMRIHRSLKNLTLRQFCRDVIKVKLWEKQHALSDLVDSGGREIYVPTGHGIGKTFHAANIVAYWMAKYGPGTKVISSAPTYRQVAELLWRELEVRWNRTPLLRAMGEVRTTELEISSDWVAYGFSTDDPNKFQGWHAPHLFVLIDEANAFPDELWEALDACMTGQQTQLVALGNTIVPMGRFYEACEHSHHPVLRISSREHPNVVHDKVYIPGAVTREWVDKIEEKYGKDSQIARARVDAIFPETAVDSLLSIGEFKSALQPALAQQAPSVLSIDVARFGSNLTAAAHLLGCNLQRLYTWGQSPIDKSAERVLNIVTQHHIDYVVVDDDGVGGGLTDALSSKFPRVVAFRGGLKAHDEEHYYNMASEAYGVTRELWRKGLVVLPPELPLLPELQEQLTLRQYMFDAKGRFVIEPKKKFIKRTNLRSPDEADALVMGLWWVKCCWQRLLEAA